MTEKNITLSIDAKVQSKMYEFIESLAGQVGFDGGAGIIMNITMEKFYLWRVFQNTGQSNI